MLKLKTLLASLAATLALSGCMTDPHKAYTVNQAKTPPVRNLTNMDLALGCLDRLLVEYHVQPMYITSPGLPGRAGDKASLSSGVDILKTSIGQLAQSNAFRYVDLSLLSMSQYGNNANEAGSRPLDPAAIDTWIKFLSAYSDASGFRYPGYIIAGSISQLDNSVLSDEAGGSIGSDQIGSFGLNADQIVSVVTVDMQIVGSQYLQVMNGLTTKNSLAVAKKGIGAEISGRIKTVGGYFNVSYDRSEGLHQGIRDLIQLGLVELLGKLAKVPYQRCLQTEGASPGSLQTDEDRFEDMSEEKRIRLVQQRLAALSDPSSFDHARYYNGPVTGTLDPATRDAIARYRRQAGLIANAEIDLDLYRSLTHAASAPPVPTPSRLSFIDGSGRPLGPQEHFPLGTSLRVGVNAGHRVHAQCFLRRQDQQVYRVFPTTDQPDDVLSPGRSVFIPGPNAPLQILLDTPSEEEIGCISAENPLRAGAMLPLQALGSAPVPRVDSLQAVFEQYQKAQGGEAVGMDVLRFSSP